MDSNRKLAVIMFTDMVGYSAMIHKDESLALQLLEEHNSILRSIFNEFEGREIKTSGDSFLSEFSSALGATQCAIKIQSALHQRNELVSDEKKIYIRIGIHLGDVVEKDNDVFGDGVNIAARIEPLAPAGGILISEDVWRQVQNKLEYGTTKIVSKKLKNIDLPFGIYSVDLPWAKEEDLKSSETWQRKLGARLKPRNLFIIGFGLVMLTSLSYVLLYMLPSFNEYTIQPLTSFEGIELNPSWSPDGSQIAFQSSLEGNTDIYTKTSGGEGAVHNLTNSPYDEWKPSWSPNGTYIAYLCDRGKGTTIYSVPSTGGSEREIVNTNISISKLGTAIFSMGKMPWSPDGKLLVYSSQKEDGTIQLCIVDIEKGTKQAITDPPPGSEDLSASWSHDGKKIIFNRGIDRKINVISYNIRTRREKVVIQDEFNYLEPVWSPDNLYLLLRSGRSGASNLWEYHLKSSTFNQITFGQGADLSPIYAKSGEIVYSNMHHEINIYRGGVMDPIHMHTQITSHTKEDFYPRVSPDGTKIVYQSNRTGNEEIWLYDMNLNTEFQLTVHPKKDRVPEWSKSGTEIVFVSNRSGVFQLLLMDIDGKNVRELTRDTIDMPVLVQNASNAAPRFSPDGSRLGYVVKHFEGTTLRIVQADGKNPVFTEIHGIISFDWYKDNDHIVYSKKESNESVASPMYLRSISSGKEILLVDDTVTEICVSPSSELISYCASLSHFGQTLNILPIDYDVIFEKLVRPLEEPIVYLDGKGKWHPHNGGWTQDSKQVLYSKDTDEGDLYILKPKM